MTCMLPPFSKAFTFLVPTLLTLAKFAQPQTTTAPPLPKMPMVDVPAKVSSTGGAVRCLSQGCSNKYPLVNLEKYSELEHFIVFNRQSNWQQVIFYSYVELPGGSYLEGETDVNSYPMDLVHEIPDRPKSGRSESGVWEWGCLIAIPKAIFIGQSREGKWSEKDHSTGSSSSTNQLFHSEDCPRVQLFLFKAS